MAYFTSESACSYESPCPTTTPLSPSGYATQPSLCFSTIIFNGGPFTRAALPFTRLIVGTPRSIDLQPRNPAHQLRMLLRIVSCQIAVTPLVRPAMLETWQNPGPRPVGFPGVSP